MGASGTGRSQTRKVARRWVLVSYFAFVVLVIVASTLQIAYQAMRRPSVRASTTTCVQGLIELDRALGRARDTACRSDLPEHQAVLAFQEALHPEWGLQQETREACKANHLGTEALDAVVELRYAEEHAARREALELADRRRKVHELLDRSVRAQRPADENQGPQR